MSEEARLLMTRMLGELSMCKYLYKNIIAGCYDTAVEHGHFTPAPEGREYVVNQVLQILKDNYE